MWQPWGMEPHTHIFEAWLYHRGVTFKERTALVFVDLMPDVGNFFEAFLNLRSKFALPLFYFCTCVNNMHLEWYTHTCTENMTKAFTDNQVTIPGYKAQTGNIPEAILEQPPPRPPLNILVWMADKEDKSPRGVKVTKALMDKWYQHPSYGDRFREFYDELVATCGIEEMRL